VTEGAGVVVDCQWNLEIGEYPGRNLYQGEPRGSHAHKIATMINSSPERFNLLATEKKCLQDMLVEQIDPFPVLDQIPENRRL
jgi:hypothetical protein